MALFRPKDHIPLGEAVGRLGRGLYPNDWTGKEFLPASATTTGIDSDTDAYLIGWVARHCDTEDEGENTSEDRVPLSVATTERWIRATEVYRIARGMLDGTILECPKDFPLGPDDLDALEAETAAFRAPRLAAHNRLLKAIQLMRRELYGTPPDCKDAIPALWCSPDEPPAAIDPKSWFGPDGLNRLRDAVQADCEEQGSSRIVVPLEHVDAVCLKSEPEEEEQPPPNRPGRPSFRDEIARLFHQLAQAGKADFTNRKANFEQIRSLARKARKLRPQQEIKGFGDDVIGKVIGPIIDELNNGPSVTG